MRKSLFVAIGFAVLGSTVLISQIQPIPSVRISGVVRDSTTGLPIADSRISITPGRLFRDTLDVPGIQFLTSGPDGGFSSTLPAGPYVISATAEGYVPSDGLPLFIPVRRDRSLVLTLAKPSRLSGRVIDGESAVPIPQLQVQAHRIEYKSGNLVESRSYSALSDKDGVWEFPAILPGRYMVEFMARDAREAIELMPSERDRTALVASETHPLKYGRTWWPANPLDGHISGLKVAEGSDVRVGEIKLVKRALFSVTGTMNTGACGGGDIFVLTLTRTMGAFYMENAEPVNVACGEQFIAHNLSPRESYQVSGQLSPEMGEPRFVRESITISDRDLIRDIVARPGVRINGRIEFPDGFQSPRVQVTMISSGVGPAATVPAASVSSDGKFGFVVLPDATARLSLNLPEPYYVSSATYSGQPMQDLMLSANATGPSIDILLKVAAGGAAISGTVKSRDKPLPAAVAVLVPWPLRMFGDFPINFTAPIADGIFRFTQVPPDSYRLVVVEDSAWNTEFQKPGILNAVAASSTSLDVQDRQDIKIDADVTYVVINQ